MDEVPEPLPSIKEGQMALYLQGVAEASQRSRAIVLTLTTVSALTFFALLGQLQSWGWPQQRMAVSQNVLRYWPLTYLQDPTLQDPTNEVKKSDYNHALAFAARYAGVDPNEIKWYGWLSDEPTRREVIILSNFVTTYNADVMRMNAEKVRCFTIPVFGVAVDINHLGLLSGLSFFVLVWLLSYCIRREKENVLYTFQAASRINQLQIYYELMASHNVLTVPPAVGVGRPHASKGLDLMDRVHGLFLQVFLSLPAAMQLTVAWYETRTGKGFVPIFPIATRVEIIASWSLFAGVAVVTILCFRTRRTILHEWRLRARQLESVPHERTVI